ncbi:MAG TPA: LuxR C-terminal-related transcriptional regulator [Burkholderiaceae bacterium]|nr:LuxR C-terminal-related transcriptional regulator [Burkholderiaceae bacterium]
MQASKGHMRAVLASKLCPPSAIASNVVRSTLCEIACTSQAAKLVLVRAPSGFGKTTALAQFHERLEQMSVVAAWLTLDAADNDISRFLTGLEEATACLQGINFTDSASGESRTVGDRALDLIARLSQDESPYALFLDDLETIQDAGVLALIREIIASLPRRGRLFIGSRTMPDLGLGRLRARGQLVEIDSGKLRFSTDETAKYFGLGGKPALAAEDLLKLQRKTEGWVAALWLASLALERHHARSEFIAKFSGSDQSMADYLVEDVLAGQTEAVRNFLLSTSILKNLSPPLCDALLGRTDSANMLRRLASQNVLLTPIDGTGDSYRYHSLFAGFLRSQLARESPDELRRLHRAASAWYESQGRPVPAIDHAIAATDFVHAVSMLRHHAPGLLSEGRMRLLSEWFDSLPNSAWREEPELEIVRIWATCFTRGPWQAMEMLEAHELQRSMDPQLVAHVLALKPVLLAMMDRYDEAHAASRESVAKLPTGSPFADAVMANAVANIFSVMGDHGEARRLLDIARIAQSGESGTFNLMYSETVEGIIDLQEARMRQATARFRVAVTATHAESFRHTSGNAWAGMLYAGAVYEGNDLQQAKQLLHVYGPLVREVGLPDHMITGYVMQSRIAFDQGEVDHAFHALTELEYIGHRRKLPRVVASAQLERSRLLLLQGHTQAAKAELDRAEDPDLWQRVSRQWLFGNDLEYLQLCRLRWEVVAGDAGAAVARLETEIAQAVASARHRRALKLRIIHSMGLCRSGESPRAFQGLSDVMRAASAEGFVRLWVDEGPACGALLQQFDSHRRADSFGKEDPIFLEYLHRLLGAFGSGLPPLEQQGAPVATSLTEPLSPKELRVLLLLAEGYSNTAMAEKLFVSNSTIRTHLRNINSKLDSHNRTQAVAVARRFGLIR